MGFGEVLEREQVAEQILAKVRSMQGGSRKVEDIDEVLHGLKQSKRELNRVLGSSRIELPFQNSLSLEEKVRVIVEEWRRFRGMTMFDSTVLITVISTQQERFIEKSREQIQGLEGITPLEMFFTYALLSNSVNTKDGPMKLTKWLTRIQPTFTELFGEDGSNFLTTFVNYYSTLILPKLQDREYTLVVSTELIDFMLMSESGITSCLRLAGRGDGRRDLDVGEYCAGISAYAYDTYSAIAYITTGNKPCYIGDESFDVPFKVWRSILLFNNEFTCAVVDRQYPQNNEEFAKRVREVVARKLCDFHQVEYKWVKLAMSRINKEWGGSVGYGHDDPTSALMLKGAYLDLIEQGGGSIPIDFQVNDAKCLSCGCEDIESDNTVFCDDCADGGGVSCYFCGRTHHVDDMVMAYDERGNVYDVCGSCTDNIAYCEDCSEYHFVTECTYIEYLDRTVCSRCLDRMYIQCSHCETYFLDGEGYQTNDGDVICEGCYQDHYFTCDRCEEVFGDSDMVSRDTGYFCSTCSEEIDEEEAEESAEDDSD